MTYKFLHSSLSLFISSIIPKNSSVLSEKIMYFTIVINAVVGGAILSAILKMSFEVNKNKTDEKMQ